VARSARLGLAAGGPAGREAGVRRAGQSAHPSQAHAGPNHHHQLANFGRQLGATEEDYHANQLRDWPRATIGCHWGTAVVGPKS